MIGSVIVRKHSTSQGHLPVWQLAAGWRKSHPFVVLSGAGGSFPISLPPVKLFKPRTRLSILASFSYLSLFLQFAPFLTSLSRSPIPPPTASQCQARLPRSFKFNIILVSLVRLSLAAVHSPSPPHAPGASNKERLCGDRTTIAPCRPLLANGDTASARLLRSQCFLHVTGRLDNRGKSSWEACNAALEPRERGEQPITSRQCVRHLNGPWSLRMCAVSALAISTY